MEMMKLIREFLNEKRGYLKKSNEVILERLGIPVSMYAIEVCARIKKEIKIENTAQSYSNFVQADWSTFKPHKPIEENIDNILIIGDLHEPFCLDGYLAFCKKIYKENKCGTVIFIGDLVDNHYSSYHETDPDGYSAGEELDRAIDKIAKWYKIFPKAYVIIGNHDRLVYRKAYSAGVSSKWIREYDEVLETPGWEFLEEIEIGNVSYNHGEGGTARTRMKNEMQSQVQGHIHSQFYLDYNVSPVARMFAMQVGCGVDRKAYSMAYGRNFKKPIVGCATVCNGKPQLHPMEL